MTMLSDDDSYDEIDKDWRKIWLDADGERHSDGDFTAVVLVDGSVAYYKDGKNHRDGDLPAVIYINGDVFYYKYGKIHRDGGRPAFIRIGGWSAC